MDAKLAANSAIQHVADLFGPNVQNLGLEEIEYVEGDDAWDVTVGFSRPWDFPANATTLLSLTADSRPLRKYKVVRIREDGSVAFIRIREPK